MVGRGSDKSNLLPLAAVLAVTLALAACSGQKSEIDDVSRRHPIVIERHAVTLTVSAAPSRRRINASTAATLDDFFDGYFDDGGGRMLITTPPGTTSGSRSAMANAIRDRAVRRGIDVSDVDLVSAKPGPGANRTYRLRYLHHTVRSPRCGHWSAPSPFNPRNVIHPNHGCASQSYLGRMTAHPRDLVAAHPAGPRDTTRSNTVIQLYRKGEATAAKESPNEKTIRTLTIK